MSSYREIAQRIPAEYRKEILETNIITKAQASAMDVSMVYLFIIWRNHVEPNNDLSLECGLCITRILDNFKQLLDTLVELEKESRLLNSL